MHNHRGHSQAWGATDTLFQLRAGYFVAGHLPLGADRAIWFDEAEFLPARSRASFGKRSAGRRLDAGESDLTTIDYPMRAER